MSSAASPARRATAYDQAAYWLTVVAVYFLVGVLFFYSGKSKLFDQDGKAPQPLREQFEGTFIGTFPGIDTAWVILGILEFGLFLLMLASLVREEFLPHRPKALLLDALALALLTFACLSFGQTSTGNNEGTASLYTYFASTAIIFLLVLRLPPNRPGHWLSARLPAPVCQPAISPGGRGGDDGVAQLLQVHFTRPRQRRPVVDRLLRLNGTQQHRHVDRGRAGTAKPERLE